MGTCINCEKETANSYTYYSGVVTNYSSGYHSTSISYGNLKQHADYLCTKCVSGNVGTVFGAICTGVSLLIASTILFVLGIIFWGFNFALLGLYVVFAGSFIIAPIVVVRQINLVKGDSRVSDDTGAKAICEYMRKKSDSIAYLTPADYQFMKSQNQY